MAANAFINYYEAHQNKKEINLKNFLINQFVNKTPVKLKVIYNSDSNFASSIKECILNNLFLNDCFTNNSMEVASLKGLYKLFKKTNEQIGETEMAQLISCLHFSKGVINFERFEHYFSILDSLKVVDFTEFEYFSDLNDFFNHVIKNQHLMNQIENAILDITSSKSSYQFENTQLKFFKLNGNILNGFAGINTIYINTALFTSFTKDFFFTTRYTNKDDVKVILKMQFLQIIVHEIIHVAVRFMKNDMNISSPKDLQKERQVTKPIDEAGTYVERVVFGNTICWYESALKDLNIEYCKQYLNELLSNFKPNFEIEKAKVVIDNEPATIMGISYNYKFYKFKFY